MQGNKKNPIYTSLFTKNGSTAQKQLSLN